MKINIKYITILSFLLSSGLVSPSFAKNFISLSKSTSENFIKTVGSDKCDNFCPNDQDAVFKQTVNNQSFYAYIKNEDNSLIIASVRSGEKANVKKIAIRKSMLVSNDDVGLAISPNLFVLKNDVNAIGVVSKSSEMYSGGGATYESIDLIEFSGREANFGNYLYSNIPFSCNKMIRACFNDWEYKKYKHCHDESYGILKYHGTNEQRAKFTWQLTTLPAQTTEKHIESLNFNVMPQDVNIVEKVKINFCRGE